MTTREELQASVAEGRSFFATKNTAGLNGVAHATIVSLGAAPASAQQHIRKWFRDELAKANDKIAAGNAQRKGDRDKGFASFKGEVTLDSLKAEGAEDPAAELKRLRGLAELDEDEFKRGQLVKLKKYHDKEDVESTAVIRFVFELYQRSDAPLVSRYAKVLDWIKARFQHQANVNVEAIVAALKAEGGFEAVLQQQRRASGSGQGGNGKGKGGSQDAATKPAQADDGFRAETHTVTMRLPLSLPELPSQGLLSLHVICWGPDEIQVIAYQPLTEAELEELKAQFEATIAPTIPEGPDAPHMVPTAPDTEPPENETVD